MAFFVVKEAGKSIIQKYSGTKISLVIELGQQFIVRLKDERIRYLKGRFNHGCFEA